MIRLQSLKVSANLDASGYARGAAQKTAADQSMIGSSRAVGAALAAEDAALQKTVPGLSRLSAKYIEGYGPAAKLQAELRKIGDLMERGLSFDRAALLVRGASTQLGQLANSASLARQNYSQLASVVDQVNAEIAEQGGIAAVAAARMNQTAASLSRMRGGAALASHQMANLSFQLQDIAVGLASGQSPFTVLMQQGSQIGQSFAASGAKLTTVFKQLGAGLLQFVTNPVNLAVIGFSALAAGAAYAFQQMQSKLPSLEDLLKQHKDLIGELGERYKLLGRDISSVEPRSQMVIEFDLRFNAEQADKRLQKEIDTFAKSYQPREQSVLLPVPTTEGVFGQFVPFGSSRTVNERFMPFKEAFDSLVESTKKGLPDLNRFHDEIVRLANLNPGDEKWQKAADEILQMGVNAAKAQREINAYTRSLDANAAALHNLFSSENQQKLLGDEPGLASLRSFVPDLRTDREKIEETYAALQKIATGDQGAKVMVQATEARQSALTALNNEIAKTNMLHDLELRALNAKSPAEQAGIAASRARIELMNQAVSAGEAEAKAQQAAALAYAQAAKAIDDQNRARKRAAEESIASTGLEAELIGKSAAETAVLRANWQAYMDLRRQAEDNNTAFDQAQYQRLVKINEELGRSVQLLEDAKRAEQNRQGVRAAAENVAGQRFEIELIGKPAAETAVLRANWQAYMDLRRRANETHTAFDEAQFQRLQKINAELGGLVARQNELNLQKEIDFERKLSGLSPSEADIARRLKGAGIEESTAAWNRLAEQIRETNREQQSFFTGMRKGFYEMVEHVNDFASSGKDIMDHFFGGLEDQWVKFAQTGKFSFKDMLNNIIGDISRMAYRMSMTGIMGLLGFGSTAPNQGGSSFGGVFQTVFGNLFGGSQAQSQAPGAAPSLRPGSVSGGAPGGLGSLFGSFFSGGAQSPAAAPGRIVPGSVSGGAPGGIGDLFGPLFSGGASSRIVGDRRPGATGTYAGSVIRDSLPSIPSLPSGASTTGAALGLLSGVAPGAGGITGGVNLFNWLFGRGGASAPSAAYGQIAAPPAKIIERIPVPAAPPLPGLSAAYGRIAAAPPQYAVPIPIPQAPAPVAPSAPLPGLSSPYAGLPAARPGVSATPSWGDWFSNSRDWLRGSFFDANPRNPFNLNLAMSLPKFGDNDDDGIGGKLGGIGSWFTSLLGGADKRQAPALSAPANTNIPIPRPKPWSADIAAPGTIPGWGLQPSSQVPFFNLIGRAEGTDRGRGYNETLGYGRFTGGPRNLTGMSLDEINTLQRSMLAHPENSFNSSAIGRYQITRRTMLGLRDEMGLKGDELFDVRMQDRMAGQLMQRRGPDIAGLRNEWEGLRRVPGNEILRNFNASQTSLANLGKNDSFKSLANNEWWQNNGLTDGKWQEQLKQAQEALGQSAGELSASVHRFSNDLNANLTSITDGAQNAGSGFGSALGGILQSIVGKFGGATGSILSPLIGALFSGFDKGGYTGDRQTHEVAGVVHGKEFVVNAAATSRNRPVLEAMNSGKLGHANDNRLWWGRGADNRYMAGLGSRDARSPSAKLADDYHRATSIHRDGDAHGMWKSRGGGALKNDDRIAGIGWHSDGGGKGSRGDGGARGGSPHAGSGHQGPRFAHGGLVGGLGDGWSDSNQVRVSRGEFIVNSESTRRHMRLLEAINAPSGRSAAPVNAGMKTDAAAGPQKAVNVTQHNTYNVPNERGMRRSANQMAAMAGEHTRRAARVA